MRIPETMLIILEICIFAFIFALLKDRHYDVQAFSPIIKINKRLAVNIISNGLSSSSTTQLYATNKDSSKRRRRKSPPGAPTKDPIKISQEKIEILDSNVGQLTDDDDYEDDDADENQKFKDDLLMLNEIASFEFQKDKEMIMGLQQQKDINPSRSDTSLPLPDITQVRRLKQEQNEILRQEQEKEETKVKINRKDKVAMKRLLEQQPFSDADDTLFEEEAYGTISVLLGERAKPFLGIPFGPLQVGHFIGSLGIILMSFVEYPGFPLTNLPSPVRGCLQGGLASVYTINILLSIVSVFKAKERGQEVPLWVIKTIAVGGLAFDQLTQLPTLEEIEKAQSIKGARAIKKK